MLYSMAHFQPLVQGYSGIQPPGYAELERTLMRFPDDETVGLLADLDVTYAAVHMDSYGAEERAQVDAALARLESGGRLQLAHAEDEGRVYRIVR